jgi:hypothetical protein
MLRTSLLLTFLFFSLTAAGCGQAHVPVTGAVTVDGQPLTTGSVTFHPAGTAAGTDVIGHGPIDPTGKYTLVSEAGSGLPAGAYKVVVNAGAPSDPKNPYSLPVLLVDKKYTDLATTPLTIEVARETTPDKFNLTLTK